ncbi:MAG: hypothetical protein PVG12_09080 [Gammaproteobacteria bacterium]|jgi:hypothetical protein
MSELFFLGIAGAAAVFKVAAILVGVIWAFHSLLSAHSIPLNYRHTRAEITFRPKVRRY